MSLTLHYHLEFAGNAVEAQSFVTQLHEAAVKFGAGEVRPIRETTEEEPVLGISSVTWVLGGENPVEGEPLEFFAFVLNPGEGCEPATFGLARYPATIQVDSKDVETEMGKGWHWVGHVKTQYASNPAYGGIQNFLQCHLTICAMLEKAKEYGATVFVDDESGFWEHRDVKKLVAAVENLNVLLAGLVGAMKDSDETGKSSGAIQEFSNFEHLEAQAVQDPKLAESLRQVAQKIKSQS